MKITVEHYGVEGTGRNVTEAKRDAGIKIAWALRDHTPNVITWRGHVGLYWRTPTGYATATIDPSDKHEGYTYCWCSTCEHDEATICSEVMLHLMDMTMTRDDWANIDVDSIDWPRRMLPKHRDDFRTRVAFVRRYNRAVSAGLNTNDAHEYACQGPCYTAELRERVEGMVAVA